MYSYGDMPAHNLLWRECEKSSDNVAARLAEIPLVQVISLPGQYFEHLASDFVAYIRQLMYLEIYSLPPFFIPLKVY